MRPQLLRPTLSSLLALSLAACYALHPPDGGGETAFDGTRSFNPADVALPQGYRIEAVATGLTFPTGVAFDANGQAHVVESGYAYGEVWTAPRLLRVEASGRLVELARGGRNGPWNGVAALGEHFYVAEGGELEGGRILRISAAGDIQPLVAELPSMGDHHTNGPVAGPDGKLYFSIGTATNSGIVGLDNAKFGWLKRRPTFHDVPCADVELNGQNFTTPALDASGHPVQTGAFHPFGRASRPGEQVQGQVPCSGAVFRLDPQHLRLQLVAWGFRNPFGLAFAPDGRLYVTENGYDNRGSRPVWGAPDVLWTVREGLWYGWPDHVAGEPLSLPRYRAPGQPELQSLIARPPNPPPKPTARLGVHSSSSGFDFSRNPRFGQVGDAFIAQFGDLVPETGKVLAPVGFKLVRVTPASGRVEDFAVNRGAQNGPASKLGHGGLERPVAARFDPSGENLYVVDFGVMLVGPHGPEPKPGTGALWRIWRESEP